MNKPIYKRLILHYLKTPDRYFLSVILKVLYAGALLYVVLLNPKRLSHQIVSDPVVIPLQHTIQMIRNPSPGTNQDFWKQFWLNLLGNMALFVPFGFWVYESIPVINKYSTLFVAMRGLIASLIIECCQWKFRLGVFDVDDILLNTAGALIGASCFRLGRKWLSNQKIKQRIN